jgi:hypothetical protein
MTRPNDITIEDDEWNMVCGTSTTVLPLAETHPKFESTNTSSSSLIQNTKCQNITQSKSVSLPKF